MVESSPPLSKTTDFISFPCNLLLSDVCVRFNLISLRIAGYYYILKRLQLKSIVPLNLKGLAPFHMFDNLSDRLEAIYKKLKGRGVLKEADVDEALREIRVALIEADVSLPVIKDFGCLIKNAAYRPFMKP